MNENSLLGITSDKPLVEADLITERAFCLLKIRGAFVKDSQESVLELCLLSEAS